jgi:deoxyribonuclease-4
VERANATDCETIQLFSRNPRAWRLTPLEEGEVHAFQRDIAAAGIFPIFIHMPYLPNLATSDPRLRWKSHQALCEEMMRAQTLGAQFVIAHIGSAKGVSRRRALKNVANSVNEALGRANNEVRLLLENTAGMGSEVGARFEEIAEIIERVEQKGKTGICLDTAHAYQAGYDLSSREGFAMTLRRLDEYLGLDRVFLLHLNDSKSSFGSKVDRHWHVGKGCIGIDGFRRIILHPKLGRLPAIMETPRTGIRDDLSNMRRVRKLAGG